VIKGQLVGARAIDALKAVAQEQVEPGEGRCPVLRDEIFQRYNAGNRHFETDRANMLLIFIDNIDPVEKDRLDRVLP